MYHVLCIQHRVGWNHYTHIALIEHATRAGSLEGPTTTTLLYNQGSIFCKEVVFCKYIVYYYTIILSLQNPLQIACANSSLVVTGCVECLAVYTRPCTQRHGPGRYSQCPPVSGHSLQPGRQVRACKFPGLSAPAMHG